MKPKDRFAMAMRPRACARAEHGLVFRVWFPMCVPAARACVRYFVFDCGTGRAWHSGSAFDCPKAVGLEKGWRCQWVVWCCLARERIVCLLLTALLLLLSSCAGRSYVASSRV
eukprot:1149569-Prymnesium_polylepis.2